MEEEHSKPTEESSDIQFTKEIDLEPNEDEPKTDEPKTDEPKTDEPKTDEPRLVIIEDPYQHPDDRNLQSQIEKATQEIVLNDITEPVVEPVYDNVDIVTETVDSPRKVMKNFKKW